MKTPFKESWKSSFGSFLPYSLGSDRISPHVTFSVQECHHSSAAGPSHSASKPCWTLGTFSSQHWSTLILMIGISGKNNGQSLSASPQTSSSSSPERTVA